MAQDGLVRCDLIWSGFGQNQRLRANQSSLEPSSVPTSGLHQHRDQRRGIIMWRILDSFNTMKVKRTIWHHEKKGQFDTMEKKDNSHHGIGEATNIETDAEGIIMWHRQNNPVYTTWHHCLDNLMNMEANIYWVLKYVLKRVVNEIKKEKKY